MNLVLSVHQTVSEYNRRNSLCCYSRLLTRIASGSPKNNQKFSPKHSCSCVRSRLYSSFESNAMPKCFALRMHCIQLTSPSLVAAFFLSFPFLCSTQILIFPVEDSVSKSQSPQTSLPETTISRLRYWGTLRQQNVGTFFTLWWTYDFSWSCLDSDRYHLRSLKNHLSCPLCFIRHSSQTVQCIQGDWRGRSPCYRTLFPIRYSRQLLFRRLK